MNNAPCRPGPQLRFSFPNSSSNQGNLNFAYEIAKAAVVASKPSWPIMLLDCGLLPLR